MSESSKRARLGTNAEVHQRDPLQQLRYCLVGIVTTHESFPGEMFDLNSLHCRTVGLGEWLSLVPDIRATKKHQFIGVFSFFDPSVSPSFTSVAHRLPILGQPVGNGFFSVKKSKFRASFSWNLTRVWGEDPFSVLQLIAVDKNYSALIRLSVLKRQDVRRICVCRVCHYRHDTFST